MKKSSFLSLFALSLLSLSSFAQSTDKSVSVQIGNLIVADRNLGSEVPNEGVALNYTNKKSHTDHKNKSFKGGYYTWDKALTICPNGWRLPTEAELEIIKNAMQFSDGRAYLKDGDGNRCYFPLSGFSDFPSSASGNYWSSTEYDINLAWSLGVYTSRSDVNKNFKYHHSLSVRCVKTAE